MALLVKARHSFWQRSISAFKNMDTAVFKRLERYFITIENMLIVDPPPIVEQEVQGRRNQNAVVLEVNKYMVMGPNGARYHE
jgi:hypothetical protein